MAKKNSSGVTKKDFLGLKRVVIEGKRVWEYKGGFYDNLKELDMVTNPHKYARMNFTPKVKEDEEIMGDNPPVFEYMEEPEIKTKGVENV